MPLVNFEGLTHDFPDDFTDEDISLALSAEQTIVTPLERDTPIDGIEGTIVTPLPRTENTGVFTRRDAQPDKPKVKQQAKPVAFREELVLKKDEGVRRNKEGNHIAYKDSLGFPTGGRGHLLTKEEKKLYPEGSVIPKRLVDGWFQEDMEEADKGITDLLEQHQVHVPDEVFDILHNMTFNLGKKGIGKFTNMWVAIEIGDWKTASKEMLDSLWAKQVKNRAVRLANRMASVESNVEITDALNVPTE